MNISLIDVAELVAVVTTHPTVAVEVALAVFVTVRVAEPVPPPTVKLPDNAVELADAFLMVSPALSLSCVVLAPPRNSASALAGVVSTPAVEIVVLAVAPKVARPIALSVPFTSALGVVRAPAVEIVVLAVAPKVARPIALSVPFTSALGAVRTPAVEMVVLAVAPKVERPTTLSAPLAVTSPVSVDAPVTASVPPVEIFVLIVVAAWAMPALMKTTARARTVVRTPLPRLFRYVLMLFIIIVKVLYCK